MKLIVGLKFTVLELGYKKSFLPLQVENKLYTVQSVNEEFLSIKSLLFIEFIDYVT